jgi:hypothetical protein
MNEVDELIDDIRIFCLTIKATVMHHSYVSLTYMANPNRKTFEDQIDELIGFFENKSNLRSNKQKIETIIVDLYINSGNLICSETRCGFIRFVLEKIKIKLKKIYEKMV